MAKKKTVNQQLWDKEVRRIKNFIRNAEKRGFRFDEDIIPDRPDKVYKRNIEQLKELQPHKLYGKAKYYDAETGETVSGREGRFRERSRASQKGWQTTREKPKTPPLDIPPLEGFETLENIREMIRGWSPALSWSQFWTRVKEADKNAAEMTLSMAINTWGEDIVARRLQAEAKKGPAFENMVDYILYGSDTERVDAYMSMFTEVVNGGPLTNEESQQITEMIEDMEYYNEGTEL